MAGLGWHFLRSEKFVAPAPAMRRPPDLGSRTGKTHARFWRAIPKDWCPFAFSQDGKQVGVARERGTARVWDLATAKDDVMGTRRVCAPSRFPDGKDAWLQPATIWRLKLWDLGREGCGSRCAQDRSGVGGEVLARRATLARLHHSAPRCGIGRNGQRRSEFVETGRPPAAA
jgi:hypothetical protein